MFPPLRRFLSLVPALSLLAAAACPAAPELDAGFGGEGRVAVELGREGSANAVLVQPDGKILAAGSVDPGQGKNFALARFNPDGSLDAGFGGEGALATSLSFGDDEALALGLLSDGRIVAGGYSTQEGRRVFALVCYLPDGRLDRDFGRSGVTLAAIGGGDDEITALAVTPDDHILAGGTVSGLGGAVAAAARYDAYGEPDAAFGERGVVLLGVGDESRVEGILARADGGLLLSGTFRREGAVSLLLAALDAAGRLDAGFGAAGLALPPGDLPSEGYRPAVDDEGLIYVAGAVGEPGRRDTALFRFFPDGRPDPDFGRAGVAINPVSPEDDVLFDVTVHARGIVAGGFAVEAGQRRFLIASYAAANGSPEALRLPVPHLETGGKLPALSAVVKKRPKRPQRRAARAADAPEPPQPAEDGPQAPLSSAGAFGRRLLDFLLPSAAAAELPEQPPKVRLFDFGAGEAVAHAAALDAEGNVVVAGMAAVSGERPGTAMAVARLTAASLYTTDAFVNQAGGESPALRTLPPLAVTRTTARCGGEVLPDLGAAATSRGLVFGTATHPVLPPESAEHGANAAAPERGSLAAGSGAGVFSATRSGLRPATRYHVRAYAVTAGGVLYGPQRVFTTAEACFVATAAFGSAGHPAVVLFRDFRDKILMRTTFGPTLVDMYYHHSPPLARLIERHGALRPAAALLLLPLAAFAGLALAIGPAPACVVFVLPLLWRWRKRKKSPLFDGAVREADWGSSRACSLSETPGGCGKAADPFRRCAPPPPVGEAWSVPLRGNTGFTLIEVMVVMVILGILAALIAPRIMDRPEEGRRVQAQVQMRAIEQALKLYRLDNGFYPTTEQGLQALVAPPATGRPAKKWRQGGYLERGRVPRDPWGADYVYLCPGLHDEFDLISYGADNQAGGEGKDADVNNWELQ